MPLQPQIPDAAGYLPADQPSITPTEPVSKGSQDLLVVAAEALAGFPRTPRVIGAVATRYANARRNMIDGNTPLDRWLQTKIEAGRQRLAEDQIEQDLAWSGVREELGRLRVQRDADRVLRRASREAHHDFDTVLQAAGRIIDEAYDNL